MIIVSHPYPNGGTVTYERTKLIKAQLKNSIKNLYLIDISKSLKPNESIQHFKPNAIPINKADCIKK